VFTHVDGHARHQRPQQGLEVRPVECRVTLGEGSEFGPEGSQIDGPALQSDDHPVQPLQLQHQVLTLAVQPHALVLQGLGHRSTIAEDPDQVPQAIIESDKLSPL